MTGFFAPMVKTKTGQKPLKIIAATSMTIFSLFACFMGTFAWFNAVRAQNSQTDGFSVSGGSNIDILSCYAVRYDGNNGAVAIDISDGTRSIEMSEYDYIFTDRNVNTPLFLRMEITGFDDTKDLSVTIPCSGGYKNGSNQISPYLSNVVCAKFMYGLKQGNSLVVDDAHWTESEIYGGSAVTSYQGMISNASTVSGTPFVEGSSKSSSISLSIDAADVFDENYIVTRQNAQGVDVDAVVVYVVLDYYVTNSVNLVTDYINSYDNGEVQHSALFSEDIQSILVSNEGSGS